MVKSKKTFSEIKRQKAGQLLLKPKPKSDNQAQMQVIKAPASPRRRAKQQQLLGGGAGERGVKARSRRGRFWARRAGVQWRVPLLLCRYVLISNWAWCEPKC